MNSTYKSFLFIAIPALVITGLQSCAKKEKVATEADQLQGTWKLAQTATDDNGNGNIEASEIRNVPTVQNYELNFKGDNSGVEYDVYNADSTIPLHFHWSLGKDNLVVAYTLHDTIDYALINLSSSNLTLQNTTSKGLAWFSYNKK